MFGGVSHFQSLLGVEENASCFSPASFAPVLWTWTSALLVRYSCTGYGLVGQKSRNCGEFSLVVVEATARLMAAAVLGSVSRANEIDSTRNRARCSSVLNLAYSIS